MHPSSPKVILQLLVLVIFTSVSGATDTPWVQTGKDGKLIYRSDAMGNHIPDFSNCGYKEGVNPPVVPMKAEVLPGEGDAGERIQTAIDQVSKLPPDRSGFRGAVLIRKGRYPIAGSIHINTSGVVLRGEGQRDDGTVLVATGTSKRALVTINPPKEIVAAASDGDDEAPDPRPKKAATLLARVTGDYVPVGAHTFKVDSTAALRVGDEVIVRRPSTAEWIAVLGMDHIPPRPDGHRLVQWKPGSKDLAFNRVITAIKGNEVTVDAPICCAFDQKYGGATVLKNEAPHITHAGIENLRGESEFQGDTDESHSWSFISLRNVYDAWVRDVTSVHFAKSCVAVGGGSKWVTVDGCTCLDPVSQIKGGRRYSFSVDGQLTLVRNCHARNGRHDYVMGSTVAGPNVFLDCDAEQTHADSGPHQRWSVGVLYDNLTLTGAVKPKQSPSQLNIRNRGNYGTGHGWAGANQVIWNCTADQIICEQPPTAQNWVIGSIVKTLSGNGYQESTGKHVEPRSLYLSQLRERAGDNHGTGLQ